MPAAISVLSREYLWVPLEVNVAPALFTSSVSMALSKTAVPGTWWPAVYVPEEKAVRLLIGPGSPETSGFVLTPGRWFVYIKIVDSSEIPIKTALSHINAY